MQHTNSLSNIIHRIENTAYHRKNSDHIFLLCRRPFPFVLESLWDTCWNYTSSLMMYTSLMFKQGFHCSLEYWSDTVPLNKKFVLKIVHPFLHFKCTSIKNQERQHNRGFKWQQTHFKWFSFADFFPIRQHLTICCHRKQNSTDFKKNIEIILLIEQ